ncbi:MAG: arsenite methyltransferase [Bacteroidales bacterium]|jgi:SAM-dependent methyltransferase|nr:arsenite methyltransferase [Bacteroidales bacterium]
MEDVKKIVREKYGEIARENAEPEKKTSCGCGCGCDDTYTIFSENYNGKDGYDPDADLRLGCGIPTDFVQIHKGDTVIDLGSGAGNDCFVARALVGEEGKVIGIDMTKEMIELARKNADKLGYKNVQFRYGDIENMPVTSKKADVVISNCVLNLVPDKEMAVSEICRVLKVGGHFCISDVIIKGELPEKIRNAAEMYAGCVSGALEREKYMELIARMGFINISIHKEKEILIPDNILSGYLSKEEIEAYRKSGTGIFSITISGEKPAKGCVCCGT